MDNSLDCSLGFFIPDRDVRGRVVRLGPVLDQVLAAHAYPRAVEAVLAEALVLTALLGSTLKDDAGQLTLQAQTEGGPIELLVADYRAGALRGYAKFDADRIAALPEQPLLTDLFGKGYLALTFDQALSAERYQGIVPLEGASLSESVERYFAQSEQIPSLVRAAVRHGADGCIEGGCVAGGMLVQHLPEGEVGRERLHVRHDQPHWQHVAMLAATVQPDELLDPALSASELVWRLFNEEKEVRVLDGTALTRGCRCDLAHIRSVIGRFPPEEQREMVTDSGFIVVDCAFCSTKFDIEPVMVACESG